MAQTKLGDLTVNTNGELPAVGSKLPDFTLTGTDLADFNSSAFAGKKLVINIYPSIDTGVCSASVREFNKRAASLAGTAILCVSRDLPAALKRFCGAEGIEAVVPASDFRHLGFAKSFGVEMIDGKMRGMFARAVVVVGADGVVKYTEMVPAVGQEPNYDAAIAALQ